MNPNIRRETSRDHNAVRDVTRRAFEGMAFSDQTEHRLVDRLRRSPYFVPELSLVAEVDGQIVGHILFTKVNIEKEGTPAKALTLAPVSVLPAYQRKGIGGKLIEEGHRIARSLGYDLIVLVGHEDYYPRFGYERASIYGLTLNLEAPDVNFMVHFLNDKASGEVAGKVVLPDVFLE